MKITQLLTTLSFFDMKKVKLNVKDMFLENPKAARKAVRQALKQELCRVRFLKLDGTMRVMWCSQHPTFMPPPQPKKEDASREKDKEHFAVWDIEAEGFRSFKLETVKTLSYT